LHLAAGKGYPEISEVLIKSGADTNSLDTNGWTPLHLACANIRPETKHLEVVNILLDNEASPLAETRDHCVPLHYLFNHVNDPKKIIGVIERLMKTGPEILNKKNKSGESILHYAAKGSTDPMVFRYLVDNGANPFAETKRGRTVVEYCFLYNRPALASMLARRYPSLLSANNQERLSRLASPAALHQVRTLAAQPSLLHFTPPALASSSFSSLSSTSQTSSATTTTSPLATSSWSNSMPTSTSISHISSSSSSTSTLSFSTNSSSSSAITTLASARGSGSPPKWTPQEKIRSEGRSRSDAAPEIPRKFALQNTNPPSTAPLSHSAPGSPLPQTIPPTSPLPQSAPNSLPNGPPPAKPARALSPTSLQCPKPTFTRIGSKKTVGPVKPSIPATPAPESPIRSGNSRLNTTSIVISSQVSQSGNPPSSPVPHQNICRNSCVNNYSSPITSQTFTAALQAFSAQASVSSVSPQSRKSQIPPTSPKIIS
jgi:hypothetical protein